MTADDMKLILSRALFKADLSVILKRAFMSSIFALGFSGIIGITPKLLVPRERSEFYSNICLKFFLTKAPKIQVWATAFLAASSPLLRSAEMRASPNIDSRKLGV